MLPILFEDERILAINKPSGLPSHSLKSPDEDSCESRLKVERPDLNLQLLHRLDTGTSGVLLFAKSPSVFEKMRGLFQARAIRKYYLAWGEVPSNVAVLEPLKARIPIKIDVKLAHHPKSKKKMIALPEGVRREMRGKPFPALTLIHGFKTDQFLSLKAIRFDVEIVTGVTHQIRVHLKHLGFPLLGDLTYGNPETRENCPRLALHAGRVEFKLDGIDYQIEAALE